MHILAKHKVNKQNNTEYVSQSTYKLELIQKGKLRVTLKQPRMFQ